MDKVSDQKIIVYCDFSESMNWAIIHGLKISTILNKELCLYYPTKTSKETKGEAQYKLTQIINKLSEDFPKKKMSNIVLDGSFEDTIVRLVEGFDGILIVLSNDKLKPKIRALQKSRVPFLFVGNIDAKFLEYTNALLPLDYRRVMKESSIWASYFGRFNDAKITIMRANETNTSNKTKLINNSKYIEMLFLKFNIKSKFIEGKKTSFNLLGEALDYAKKNDNDLLITTASQRVTIIDLLIGLPEAKLIKQAQGLPVICINPSHNMLILCD